MRLGRIPNCPNLMSLFLLSFFSGVPWEFPRDPLEQLGLSLDWPGGIPGVSGSPCLIAVTDLGVQKRRHEVWGPLPPNLMQL